MTGPLQFFAVVAVVFFAEVTDALPPNKIVGGTAAAPGEFPYMVSLRYHGRHFCGGAIVSPRHVVTAAHCFEDAEPYMLSQIYVSTGTIFSDSGRRRAVHKIIPHPDYDSGSVDVLDDVAVVVLTEDIVFNEKEASVDLQTAFVPEGVFANVTGWGQSDARIDGNSLELMKINIKTLLARTCNRYYGGLANVPSSQICTLGGRGVGACNLDSGGPLVYNGQLIGVLSRGLPCGQGYPDVYTSVYHYLDWIKKTMEE